MKKETEKSSNTNTKQQNAKTQLDQDPTCVQATNDDSILSKRYSHILDEFM
jgi:hypothetical protein